MGVFAQNGMFLMKSGQKGNSTFSNGDVQSTGENAPFRFLACGGEDADVSTLVNLLAYDRNRVAEHVELGRDIEAGTRYYQFSTPRRNFIVAGIPGGNLCATAIAAAAPRCELTLLLMDASKGILPGTRWLSHVVHQFGANHVIAVVNKMDLVSFSRATFTLIAEEYQEFAHKLGLRELTIVPAALDSGENVQIRSAHMPWYDGQPLLPLLEDAKVDTTLQVAPMRFFIQSGSPQNPASRRFPGTVASGYLRLNDEVLALPSGQVSRICSIVSSGTEPSGTEPGQACAGDAVTVVLDDEIEAGSGDMLVAPTNRPHAADQFAAHLIWADEEKMVPHRSYFIRFGAQHATAEITSIKYKIGIDTLEHIAGGILKLNDLAICNFALDRPLIFDPYSENRRTGSFTLADRSTGRTVAFGFTMFALYRASNLTWQKTDVTKKARAELMGQKPCCLWFTGLSGSGKSTIANLLERRLFAMGRHTYILDGDNIRHGLSLDLGFTDADRVENIRRAAHAARLMVDAGLIVLTAFISPFKAERNMARELFDQGEFLEVYIDTPLEICEKRDPKGLYKKARRGLIPNFTGISSPYEAPEKADIHLSCMDISTEAAVNQITLQLEALGIL